MKNVRTGFEKLTKEEMETLYALRTVGAQSIWQVAVNETCRKGCPEQFRQLITQLKSQAKDEPVTMEKILGSLAYRAVMAL